VNEYMGECLVDNWTLELAGVLVEQGVPGLRGQRLSAYLRALDESMISGVDLTRDAVADWADYDDYFSALANLVSAILLFDNLSFARNGWEGSWQRLPAFSRQMSKVVAGRSQPESLSRYENSLLPGRVEPGALFYLALASSMKCDLLLSPHRSAALQRCQPSREPSYAEYASDLLETIDRQLAERISKSGSALLAAEVLPNLAFPALASLVLSQVRHRSEILTAAMDLRNSRGLKDLRRVIAECVIDIKRRTPYARLVESVPDAIRLALRDVGSLDPDRSSISVGFSVFFFAVEKEVGALVPPYLLFLRDVVRCRLELAGFRSHMSRLFERDE